MAENDNTIAIAIEAELAPLTAGLKKAEAEVKASAKRMEALAVASKKRLGSAMSQGMVRRSFQPYGLAEDSPAGAAGAQAAAVAEVAKETKKVEEAAKKAARPFDEMGRMTAIIGRGLAAVNAATYGVKITASLVKGEFDGISEAIRSAPFGLGEFVGLLEDGLNYAMGINAELYSEKAGEARRQEGLRRQYAQEEFALTLNAAELRLSAETAATDKMRESQELAAKLVDIQSKYQQQLNDAKTSGATDVEQRRIVSLYELEYQTAIATARRIERERAELREKAERDALYRHEQEASSIRIENREKERRKRLDENMKDVQREMDERRDAERSMREELAKYQAVNGANFMRSIGTAHGEFRFAQSGASQDVAKAQIKAAQLLQKIEDNTAAMVALSKERDFISSLR